jgi:hypothetical protein
MTIDSTPGKGSKFVCHFPLSRVVSSPPASIAGIS